MIDVIRNTMKNYILENPHTIIASVRPKVDNGFGFMVPNLAATAVTTTLGVARVTRRKLPDMLLTGARSTYDFQDNYYLLAEYTATWLVQGIVFEYNSEKYKTLYPEKRIMFGQVAYILASLEQTTSVDVGDLSGR